MSYDPIIPGEAIVNGGWVGMGGGKPVMKGYRCGIGGEGEGGWGRRSDGWLAE